MSVQDDQEPLPPQTYKLRQIREDGNVSRQFLNEPQIQERNGGNNFCLFLCWCKTKISILFGTSPKCILVSYELEKLEVCSI